MLVQQQASRWRATRRCGRGQALQSVSPGSRVSLCPCAIASHGAILSSRPTLNGYKRSSFVFNPTDSTRSGTKQRDPNSNLFARMQATKSTARAELIEAAASRSFLRAHNDSERAQQTELDEPTRSRSIPLHRKRPRAQRKRAELSDVDPSRSFRMHSKATQSTAPELSLAMPTPAARSACTASDSEHGARAELSDADPRRSFRMHSKRLRARRNELSETDPSRSFLRAQQATQSTAPELSLAMPTPAARSVCTASDSEHGATS